jgi:CBS domain-containing protein
MMSQEDYMPHTLRQSLRTDRVSQIRLRNVCITPPEQSIEKTMACMISRRSGCALVVKDQKLQGIFTERDFLSRVVARQLELSRPVAEVMTASPVTIEQHASMQTAIEVLQTHGYRHLPVIAESGEPVGVLSVKDIMHYLVEYFPRNVYNLPPTPTLTQPAREGA